MAADYLSEFSTSTALIVLVLTLLWWLTTRPLPGVPPGPRPMIPVLGNLLSIGLDPRTSFHAWRKKYGDVFSLYVGDKMMIVINSYEAMKEIFVKHGDKTNNRPIMLMMELMGGYKGVVTSNGNLWREQRTAGLAILRKLDFGKISMEAKIHEELEHLLDALDKFKGRPFDPYLTFGNAVSNVICSMLFGRRYSYDEEDFQIILRLVNDSLATAGTVALMNYFPFLKYLPGDLINIKKIRGMEKTYKEKVLMPWIQYSINNFDPADCKSFMSLYLKEMYKRQESGEETTLDIENLKTITTDIFGAGTETTTTTMRWILLYLMNYPQVQEKCYTEIMEHVGSGRMPSLSDRDNLVYVQALYSEVLRLRAVLPFGAPHSVTEDVYFNGYKFPKNCLMITNLDAVLKDEKIWEDPLEFRPERFISEDGSFIKREELIPFFLGKRVCMGEIMSKMELFLFVATLVQRYKIVPEPGKPNPSFDGVFGITYAPNDFNMCAIPRS